MTALLSLAAKRQDLLPAHLLTQGYMAWQAAYSPRWDAGTQSHKLTFSPKGLRIGGARLFHRVRAQQVDGAARPKILHVISSLEVGGSQKVVLDLMEGLGHRYRMRVLTGAVPRNVRYEGIDVALRPTRDAVAVELRRHDPDLIHVHHWGACPWLNRFLEALDAAPAIQAPVLCNTNNPTPPLRHPRISHHVFVSRFAAGIGPRPEGPCSVIYPGITAQEWAPRPRGPDAPFPTVGMVYRLAPDKLDLSSIDVMIAIVARFPQVRVLIPGGGPYFPRFVERVRRAGLRANFHFPGWVRYQDLPALYDQLDLFVAPVHTESFGIVVPYAMSKGVPVLAMRTGALAEILGDERWLCSSREELVSRALELLRDREKARRDARSLLKTSRRFALPVMLSHYDALYRRWLRARHPR